MNLLRKAFEHSEGAEECKTMGTTATESKQNKKTFWHNQKIMRKSVIMRKQRRVVKVKD